MTGGAECGFSAEGARLSGEDIVALLVIAPEKANISLSPIWTRATSCGLMRWPCSKSSIDRAWRAPFACADLDVGAEWLDMTCLATAQIH